MLFSQLPGSFNGFSSVEPSMKNLPVSLSEVSDVVMLLHRSDLYKQQNGKKGQNLVDLIIGKYDGKNEELKVRVRFIESLAKFSDF
jgi:replicative DNA helicase